MYGHTNSTVRTTEEGEQVGPKMHKCVQACEDTVWESMNQLAQAVGPHGSQNYGYRIVHRCRKKNLIDVVEHEKATPSGKGAVKITEKGQRYLNNQE